MQRIHAIYHISRMRFDGNTDFINSVLLQEPNIAVKISLHFGAIKLGLLDKEEELYKLLSTNTDYSDSNRGYHLAYYGNLMVADKLPFKDNPSIQWSAALEAFLRHFKSKEDGHYFLWRIDLLTMKQFILARKDSHLIDEATLNKIRSFVFCPPNNDYSNFQQAVETEFDELKKTILLFTGNT